MVLASARCRTLHRACTPTRDLTSTRSQMLYKVIAAALLVSSGEALKIGAGVSRRAALGKAAALAPLIAAPAFAELKRPEDAAIYKRADEGKLNAARAIERAKAGDLVDGSSATCAELDALIGTLSHSTQHAQHALAQHTRVAPFHPVVSG